MDALKGLTCPKCGGIVAIPEGQTIVKCPYCDLRSVVHGDRGLYHYQVSCQINRQQAVEAMTNFLGSNMAIAMDARKRAAVSEVFLVYLPFWAGWGRAMAWAFGEKEVGSQDHRHYEPREIKIVEDMTWNGAACDVGEFGVTQVTLNDQSLEPFNPDVLHRAGLVFEPVGSESDARSAAYNSYQTRIQQKAGLDRISQLFVRIARPRLGVVYYPLWVLRYQYRGRTFQIVIDGSSGKVLYGKAPGNTLYRAGILVVGMAAGALIGVDGPALALSLSGNSHGNGNGVFWVAIAALVFGFGLMAGAYRAFRYGEQYEFLSGPARTTGAVGNFSSGSEALQTLGKVINTLEKFQ
jgi:hypothetical protein